MTASVHRCHFPEAQVRLPHFTEPTLASMTHARLRVGQGDYRVAGRLLRAILEREPDHVDARRLLSQIAGRVDIPVAPVREERALRLERWLQLILRGS